jgi:hypothetical protein
MHTGAAPVSCQERAGRRRRLSNHDRPRRADARGDIVPSQREALMLGLQRPSSHDSQCIRRVMRPGMAMTTPWGARNLHRSPLSKSSRHSTPIWRRASDSWTLWGGKSRLARRLTTILPAITLTHALETTRIHRVAGLTGDRTTLATTRPCRAPHHTISDVGLIGGGPRAEAGRGVVGAPRDPVLG